MLPEWTLIVFLFPTSMLDCLLKSLLEANGIERILWSLDESNSQIL